MWEREREGGQLSDADAGCLRCECDFDPQNGRDAWRSYRLCHILLFRLINFKVLSSHLLLYWVVHMTFLGTVGLKRVL